MVGSGIFRNSHTDCRKEEGKMILLRLFLNSSKIGWFSVGGGMATLPFLYDMADKTGWFDYAQIADMLAVSESTPGPIGINMATMSAIQPQAFRARW